MSYNKVNVNVSGPIQPTSTYKTKILKGNHSFASQVTEPNMKYVIKHDFDLEGDVTIPTNCMLEFDGGSVSGAYTLTGANTGINAGLVKIFNTDITLAGTWNVEEAYPEWFGAKGDGIADDTEAINKCIGAFNVLNFNKDRTYNVSNIALSNNSVVDGNNAILNYIGNKALFVVNRLCTIQNLQIYVPDENNNSPVFDIRRAPYVNYAPFRKIKNVSIYADERTNEYKSKAIGFQFYTKNGEGIAWVIIEGCVGKNLDTFCKIETETRGWVNSNRFSNCIAWICGTAVQIINNGLAVEGNVFDIQFQRGDAVEERFVYDIPVDNNVTGNKFLGYLWDINEGTNPKPSYVGNNTVEVQSRNNYYMSKAQNAFIGVFSHGSRGSFNVVVTGTDGTICSFSVVHGENDNVNVKNKKYSNVNYGQIVVRYYSDSKNTYIFLANDTYGVIFSYNINEIYNFTPTLTHTITTSRLEELGAQEIVVTIEPDTTVYYPINIGRTGKYLDIPGLSISYLYTLQDSGLYIIRADGRSLGITTISEPAFILAQNVDNIYINLTYISYNLVASARYTLTKDAETHEITGGTCSKWTIIGGSHDINTLGSNVGYGSMFINATGKITYNAANKMFEYDRATAGVKREGTFAEKPASSDVYIGFIYFCTDKQTTEGATDGIPIYHKGNDVWVDALGRVVS